MVQISSQTLYLLQVLPSGRLLPLHTLGQHCRDDDGMVIAAARLAEQQAQQAQQARQQQQQQQGPAAGTLQRPASTGSALGAAAGASGSLPNAVPPSAAGGGGPAPAHLQFPAALPDYQARLRQPDQGQRRVAPQAAAVALQAAAAPQAAAPAASTTTTALAGGDSDSEDWEEREAAGASPLIQVRLHARYASAAHCWLLHEQARAAARHVA